MRASDLAASREPDALSSRDDALLANAFKIAARVAPEIGPEPVPTLAPSQDMAQNAAREAQPGTLWRVHVGCALREPPGVRDGAGCGTCVGDRRSVGRVRSGP